MIYLDNSATTKPCEKAINALNYALNEVWGNPSSLYGLGLDAENLINNTRIKIADMINARDDEIFFTGSGTEANNLSIIGAVNSMKRRGNKIVTTSVEHPSVLNTLKHLEEQGFEVTYIKPEPDGNLSAEKVLSAVDEKTILVSVMLVNNETGCIFPVSDIAEGLKSKKSIALMHTDCVQAFGKMPIDVSELGVDLLTASGHKIHGPKGIGILYKKKNLNIKPIIHGGGQEKGLRSGTESVPLIAGLGGAIDELTVNSTFNKVKELHSHAYNKLSAIDGILINSPKENTLPFVINISVKGLRSETLLHFLEKKEIYVSSGSACSKGKGSHVLNEMGFGNDRTDSALRISFSRFNTTDEINILCDALIEAQNTLRKKGH